MININVQFMGEAPPHHSSKFCDLAGILLCLFLDFV